MEILWPLVFTLIPLIIMITWIYWMDRRKIMKATLEKEEKYVYQSDVQKEELRLLREEIQSLKK